MQYWLMKSEPDVFSIDDLKSRPEQKEFWDGVRNYQARNFMKDQMKKGDQVLFYHSNATPPGVAGVAEVAIDTAVPDLTALDKKSEYFDPKATKENPRWFMTQVKFKKKFKIFVPLDELKKHKELEKMTVLQKGTRLSITPVTKDEFEFICKLGL